MEPFAEAVRKVSKAISGGTAQMYRPRIVAQLPNSHQAVVNRLVIDSPEYSRTTRRPAPHQAAIDLLERDSNIGRNPNLRDKRLRAIAREKGVPFTILTAIYMGLQQRDMEQMFQDKQVRADLQQIHGKRCPIPHPGMTPSVRKDVGNMMEALRYQIRVQDRSGNDFPRFSADRFIAAVELLDESKWLSDKDKTLCVFQSARDISQARVVIASAEEMAHRLAPQEFHDRGAARSNYIHRTYDSNLLTTYVITGFVRRIGTDSRS